jgi:hypothetical protein
MFERTFHRVHPTRWLLLLSRRGSEFLVGLAGIARHRLGPEVMAARVAQGVPEDSRGMGGVQSNQALATFSNGRD